MKRFIAIILIILWLPMVASASFQGFLKADSGTTVVIGPMLDDDDGITVKNSLTITSAEVFISKNGGAFAAKNKPNNSPVNSGVTSYYDIGLDATDTNTEGILVISIHLTDVLQVSNTYMVQNANVYDSLYAASGTDYLEVDVRGGVTIVDGTGTGEIDTDSGTVLLRSATETQIDAIETDTNSLNDTKIPNTLNTTASGNIGLDWANVENPTTAVDLSATDIQLSDTVTTLTGHTAQTADHTASLASILTDTGTTLPAEHVSIMAGVTTVNTNALTASDNIGINWADVSNPTTAVDLSATDIQLADTVTTYTGNTKQTADHTSNIAAILVDTGTTLPGEHTTIQADTDDIQTRIPAALSSGNMKSDVLALSASTEAADKLESSAETIIIGTVSHDNTVATTTVFLVSDITEATADHYNGRIIIFTSGALIGQATDITDYSLVSGEGRFTVTALTEAPADNVTFNII